MDLNNFIATHQIAFKTLNTHSSIGNLIERRATLDFDVFLPSKGRDLQREYVWTNAQAKELILSILIERPIPPIKMIKMCDRTLQIIDGKQRLTALFKFIDNQFSIELGGAHYFYSQLSPEFKTYFDSRYLSFEFFSQTYDITNNPVTIPDQFKIDWFKLINFAGTPQDRQHMDGL